MDSERAKYWTIEKAKGAVKAAFFSRDLVSQAGDGDLQLRFSEIRNAVSLTESPIGDRTLARALDGLEEEGRLERRVQGKAIRYALVISKPDRVKALARAEGASIESSGAVGGVGDASEGWAAFGIPDIVARRYRPQFRRACRHHQQALRDILDKIWSDASMAILAPARRRVTRKELAEGKDALEDLEELQVLGSMFLGYGSRVWRVLESTVPGTQTALQKGLDLNFAAETPLPERMAVTIARLAAVPVDEVRPEVDRRFARLEGRIKRSMGSLNRLWSVLSAREKERANRRLQAAVMMTATLTSVVHA
jgi:hypothetical protein